MIQEEGGNSGCGPSVILLFIDLGGGRRDILACDTKYMNMYFTLNENQYLRAKLSFLVFPVGNHVRNFSTHSRKSCVDICEPSLGTDLARPSTDHSIPSSVSNS